MTVNSPETAPWYQQLSRRPAVLAAGMFILGIALHSVVLHRPLIHLLALSGLLIAAYAKRRSARLGDILLMLGLLVAGVTFAQVEAFYFSRDHIGQFATESPRLAQLELRIDSPPRVLTRLDDEHRPLPPKQVTLATITRVKTWGGWAKTSGQTLVQLSEPHPRLSQGQIVRIVGMLQRPAPAQNPGQLDWAEYYREQRILVSLSIPHARNVHILHDGAPGPLAWLRQRTRELLASGFTANRSLDHALLRALLLGDSDPELRDVQENFKRTGTSHHLAISGMHVAVLGSVVYFFCRLLCVSPRISAGAMTSFVIFYGLMALPSPPVVRSVLLCVALGVGVMLGRGVDPIQLLALSVFAMLVYHPLDLYNAGFQLSFGTVLGLMVLTAPFTRVLRKSRDDPDARVAASFFRRTKLAMLRGWVDDLSIATIAAGLVAWAVSMPLIALHFEQLNPWAIVGSIVLGPVVFLALIVGMMKVVLTLLWPSLASTWATLAVQPVHWMRGTVEWLTHFPAADVPLPAPALWLVLAYFLLLFLATRPIASHALRWGSRAALGMAALLILLFPYLSGIAQSAAAPGATRITLLSVGAGQCAVVEPPGGRATLIDAGSTSLPDLLRKCVAPYLRTRGMTQIDTILLSHANIDHFSACADIVAAYDTREILVGHSFTGAAAENGAVDALLKELSSLERPPRVIAPQDVIPLGRDTSLAILWPAKGSDFNANDMSVVIRLTHAEKSILFTGDIQNDAMRELLKAPDLLRADILIAPHHGSSESLTDEFIAAVNPMWILSSNDRSLTNKQREFDTLVRKKSFYRTSKYGAITITISGAGEIEIQPFIRPPGDASGAGQR